MRQISCPCNLAPSRVVFCGHCLAGCLTTPARSCHSARVRSECLTCRREPSEPGHGAMIVRIDDVREEPATSRRQGNVGQLATSEPVSYTGEAAALVPCRLLLLHLFLSQRFCCPSCIRRWQTRVGLHLLSLRRKLLALAPVSARRGASWQRPHFHFSPLPSGASAAGRHLDAPVGSTPPAVASGARSVSRPPFLTRSDAPAHTTAGPTPQRLDVGRHLLNVRESSVAICSQVIASSPGLIASASAAATGEIQSAALIRRNRGRWPWISSTWQSAACSFPCAVLLSVQLLQVLHPRIGRRRRAEHGHLPVGLALPAAIWAACPVPPNPPVNIAPVISAPVAARRLLSCSFLGCAPVDPAAIPPCPARDLIAGQRVIAG